ncbi:hypothetical protein GCM10009681_05410 [Luedemannella helvata]|uniref:Uncharacterized protein n=1 Tax=Luedemannella helvata TaxID=349315 RepID=A0ABP4VYZ5_9ACTN
MVVGESDLDGRAPHRAAVRVEVDHLLDGAERHGARLAGEHHRHGHGHGGVVVQGHQDVRASEVARGEAALHRGQAQAHERAGQLPPVQGGRVAHHGYVQPGADVDGDAHVGGVRHAYGRGALE